MNSSRPLSRRNQPRLRKPQSLAWTNTKCAAVNIAGPKSSPSGVSRNRATTLRPGTVGDQPFAPGGSSDATSAPAPPVGLQSGGRRSRASSMCRTGRSSAPPPAGLGQRFLRAIPGSTINRGTHGLGLLQWSALTTIESPNLGANQETGPALRWHVREPRKRRGFAGRHAFAPQDVPPGSLAMPSVEGTIKAARLPAVRPE